MTSGALLESVAGALPESTAGAQTKINSGALIEIDCNPEEGYKVLLKSSNSRFKPYIMRIFKDKLILYPKDQQKNKLKHLEHNLNSLHVRTCDHEDKKIMDVGHDFFCFVLGHPDRDTYVYFLDSKTMMDAADSIVQAQGGSSRLSNYVVVREIASPSFGLKLLAQHKFTKKLFGLQVAS